MTDREKVIKALAYCVFPVSKGFPYQSHIADKGCEAVECPYRDDCDQMLLDALELLKEQEPKAVKIKKNAYNHEFYYCPRCDRGFEDFFRKPMFCDKCGQAVKWDETD